MTARGSKAVRKYLAAHAESEAKIVAGVGGPDEAGGAWDHVIVVPALAEESSLLDGVATAAGATDGRVLLVLVINERVSAGPDIRDANRRLRRATAERLGGLREIGDGCALGTGAALPCDVLVVDRTGERALPDREGVGRARKVGGDVALALWQRGSVRSNWIHFSDGDATQPPDRFRLDAVFAEPTSALLLPFLHEPSGDPAIDEAVTVYEISLRYWVCALAWAGSPYAFQTIGSTIVARADAYASVRGFPNRAAGEDFYLLNKLAKVGGVIPVDETAVPCGPVRLRSRRSSRVPFGTGAATVRITDAAAGADSFRTYHPGTFAVLRCWLEGLETFVATGEDPLDVATAGLGPDEAEALRGAIEGLRALPALREIRRRHAAGDIRAPVHGWFDAFRTMKLVHELRDRRFPDLPWRDALTSAPFVPGNLPSEAPAVLARLRALRPG